MQIVWLLFVQDEKLYEVSTIIYTDSTWSMMKSQVRRYRKVNARKPWQAFLRSFKDARWFAVKRNDARHHLTSKIMTYVAVRDLIISDGYWFLV